MNDEFSIVYRNKLRVPFAAKGQSKCYFMECTFEFLKNDWHNFMSGVKRVNKNHSNSVQ